jgi:hypothetical protein
MAMPLFDWSESQPSCDWLCSAQTAAVVMLVWLPRWRVCALAVSQISEQSESTSSPNKIMHRERAKTRNEKEEHIEKKACGKRLNNHVTNQIDSRHTITQHVHTHTFINSEMAGLRMTSTSSKRVVVSVKNLFSCRAMARK